MNARDQKKKQSASPGKAGSDSARPTLPYHSLISAMPEGVALTDLAGNVLFVSPQMFKIYGGESQDVAAGTSALQWVAPECREKAWENLQRLAKNEPAQGNEYVLLRKDGTRFVGEITGGAIADEHGNPRALVTVHRDITERRRATEALDNERQRFNVLMAHLPSGVVFEDQQRGVVYANERFCNLFGIATGPETLSGLNCTEAAKACGRLFADPEGFKRRIHEIVTEMNPVAHEDLTLADGRIFERSYVPVVSHGERLGHLWHYTDVTEQKRVEAELQQSLSLHDATLESTADGILVVDSSGMISSYNRKFLEMWRLGPEVVAAGNDNQALSAVMEQLSDPAAFRAKVEELYRRPEDSSRDQIYFKDGRVFDRFSQPQWLGERIVGRVWSFRDISEQKNAENALRESEQRYRRLFDEATEGISLVDCESGRILDCNQAFLELVGRTKPDLIGRQQEVLYASKSAFSQVSRLCSSSAPLMRGQPVATQVITSSGAPREVEIKANALDIGGRRMVQFFYRDLSARRRAEQIRNAAYRISEVAQVTNNLRELYALIHAIIGELMPARNFYIALYDRTTGLLDFPYFADEFDATPSPIKPGKSLTGYVLRTGEALLATPEVFDRLIRAGELETIGAPSIDWLGVPLRTQYGESIGVMTVQTYSDTTRLSEVDKDVLSFVSTQVAMAIERKRAEDALRRSEEKYRSLFEQSLDTVFISDPDGRLLDVNPAAEALFGYSSKEEMLSLPPGELFADAEVRNRLRAAIQNAGHVKDYELRMKRKNGDILTVLMTCNVERDSGGNIVCLRGILRDVTEKVKLEQQLVAAQKMESIGRLAGGVAHDFNNLLTAILGFADLMLLAPQLEEPLQSSVMEIRKAAERAADLTRQLLAFSRKQVLQPVVFDLNEFIAEHARMLQRLIGEDIELRTVLDPQLTKIKADPSQFTQILMNLVINARDAMPTGGKLTLQTTNTVLSEEYTWKHTSAKPGIHAMLAVIDNGSGMDAATLSHIFEPFFTTKEFGKGTGLGLSTTYGIVKQSGGNIWAYSEPGRGTTIKIYMPAVGEPQEEHAAPAVDPDKLLGTETVLVVEDDDMVRGLACTTLRINGYAILSAVDGEDALQVSRGHDGPIHLMLTDVVMPRMGGRELAQKLASLRPAMKVIFTSGYTDDTIVHHGILDPGVTFLQKPFSPRELLRRVRKALDGRG